MSDEKKYTERDMVLARREGMVGFLSSVWGWGGASAQIEANRLFPLPKVTRPRVVAGLRAQYKVVDGVVFGRSNASFDWRVFASIHVDDVVRVANLLNPTEEVDE